MNKTKIILPVAALMMMPLFTSCNKGALAEVLLRYDNCTIYKYGESTCHIDIDQDSEDSKDFRFKDDIEKKDLKDIISFPTDSELSLENIKGVKRSDDGKGLDITFTGFNKDHPFGTYASMRFTKDAFNRESRLGGRVRVALRNNHYLVQHKENDNIFEYKVVSFGGDFAEKLISDSKTNEPQEFHADENGSFVDDAKELIGITIANWTEFLDKYEHYDFSLEIEKLEEAVLNSNVYKMLVTISQLSSLDNVDELNFPYIQKPNLAIASTATEIGKTQTAGTVMATISSEAFYAEFAEAIK